MKTSIYILFFAFVFLSCSTNENNIPSQSFEITYNKSKNYTSTDFSGNESCGYLYASAIIENKFKLLFELTDKGNIKNIILLDYTNQKTFRTAYYNPRQHFIISNFVFEKEKNYLSFMFEGDLLNQNDNGESIFIKGKVESENFKTSGCNQTFSEFSATVNSEGFRHTNSFFSYNLDSDSYQATFTSDKGFWIKFIASKHIKEIPVGTYHFDDNSASKFNFLEYKGNPTVNNYFFKEKWFTYKCNGSFTITEHQDDLTIGTFNFQTTNYNTNQQVFSIDNGNFLITH